MSIIYITTIFKLIFQNQDYDNNRFKKPPIESN